jgi:hypothetical protein
LESVNQRASRLEEQLEQTAAPTPLEEEEEEEKEEKTVREEERIAVTERSPSDDELDPELDFWTISDLPDASEPEAKPEPEDPLIQGMNLTDERLNQLETGFGIPPKTYEPIHLDRNASIDQQLDQIAALIAQFHDWKALCFRKTPQPLLKPSLSLQQNLFSRELKAIAPNRASRLPKGYPPI